MVVLSLAGAALGALLISKGAGRMRMVDEGGSALAPISLLAADGGGRVMKRQENNSMGWQYNIPRERLVNGDVSDLRVFVYDLPPQLNDELVQCYYKENNAYPWQDDVPHGDCGTGDTAHGICGLHKAAETSQYSSDIWLHKSLLQHKNLTTNPMEADVLFIPFYGQLSAMHVWKEPCSGLRHKDRINLLVETLLKEPAFEKHGRKHVLALSHWDVRPIMNATNPHIRPLRRLVDKSQMVLLSTDPYFFLFDYGSGFVAPPWETLGFDTCRTVIIPYVPQMKLTDTVTPPHERHVTAYFKGNTNLSTCLDKGDYWDSPPDYCLLRSKMVKQLSGEDGFVMDSTDSNSEMTRKSYTVADYTEGIRNSTFCLMPRGDTPSSRRMFDAIAGGCIPVVISDEIRLPFQHTLDWANFTVRIGENDVNASAKVISHTLKKIDNATLSRLQKRLLEVRENFVFGVGSPNDPAFKAGGAASAMLAEVRATLDPKGCKKLDNPHQMLVAQ